MNYLVTGATGFLGSTLVRTLLEQGHSVRALFRNPEKVRILPIGVSLVKGDILDQESLSAAMRGCDGVFHAAAFTGVWAKNPEEIFTLNVTGTTHVLDASLAAGVKRVVLTSSAGVLGYSVDGQWLSEDSPVPEQWFSEYERTKFLAESLVPSYLDKGLEIVIVNPSRIFGPGPLAKSNSITRMIRGYARGSWRVIPGNGEAIGNYVYVEDVAMGHLLAMLHGSTGERYILGGENLSYRQFFEILGSVTGKRRRMLPLSRIWMDLAAHGALLLYKVSGIPPFITPALVRKFTRNCPLDHSKANHTIHYHPLPVQEGVKRTLEWLAKS